MGVWPSVVVAFSCAKFKTYLLLKISKLFVTKQKSLTLFYSNWSDYLGLKCVGVVSVKCSNAKMRCYCVCVCVRYTCIWHLLLFSRISLPIYENHNSLLLLLLLSCLASFSYCLILIVSFESAIGEGIKLMATNQTWTFPAASILYSLHLCIFKNSTFFSFPRKIDLLRVLLARINNKSLSTKTIVTRLHHTQTLSLVSSRSLCLVSNNCPQSRVTKRNRTGSCSNSIWQLPASPPHSLSLNC